ncbi:NAD(P)/FAD-dependent oxidoreductase [Pseudophaeobacter sp.]|uniref:NAD(P)/FAD-dependent oxidoreductase n=1 Tax=Pseudophaeobacter sp. TaxID=1971739 RepID=UPI004057DD82
MKRIFSDYAYGPGPRNNCWWDETIATPIWPEQSGELQVDVAVIGGGFTGLSAALHLAEAGASVALLEAESPAWGASGRNGGFCCLGGSKLSAQAMRRKFGTQATATYEAGEEAAVALVADLLTKHGIQADTHSKGETRLAHGPRALKAMAREAAALKAAGEEVEFLQRHQLADAGLNGEFHGALTTPVGFGLNPRKYLFGLAQAAKDAGAQLFQNSPALRIESPGNLLLVTTPKGAVRSNQVIIATNGYSSDDLPHWLSTRYMPTQSTAMVTRPLSEAELQAQGWFSDQMAYDSRNMLHYFRLMPDRRFLFGMRGGLIASPRNEAAIRRKLRADFESLFPKWSEVETTHCWSGMVCLSRDLVPFVGAIPDHPGLFAGLCYHGNGVAMGSYAGRLLADLTQGKTPDLPYSKVMQQLQKFPFGAARRLVMPPAYALLGMIDRLSA